MRIYHLKDVLYFSRKKSLPITIDGNDIGYVRKTTSDNLEKSSTFSYTSIDEQDDFILGIKNNGWKRLIFSPISAGYRIQPI